METPSTTSISSWKTAPSQTSSPPAYELQDLQPPPPPPRSVPYPILATQPRSVHYPVLATQQHQQQNTESVNWCRIGKALGYTVLGLAVVGAIVYGVMEGIIKGMEKEHQRFW